MYSNVTVIVGTKWGDEGKGKVAAAESQNAKVVIRATGGNNAGHTVVHNGKELPLHLVPGGIVYPETTCIIGPGVVLDLEVLLSEIDLLKSNGINLDNRLKISGRAHVILPYHKDLDVLHEKIKNKPVGTTKRGIGPCYADKANRVGIRMYDLLLEPEKLKEKIYEASILHNQAFLDNNMPECQINVEELTEIYSSYGVKLKKYITNIDPIISIAIDNRDKIVVEGAQAFRLDLDHGDYPMVTSSNPVSAGTLCGAAIPPQAVKTIIGIDKAYNSRVGNGPFPTEVPSSNNPDQLSEGDIIRELGHEYGTTTKRPRRCGWMDIPILRSAKYTCGLDALCINHLDTLGKIGEKLGYIKVCVAYRYQGKTIDYFPDDISLTGEIPTPIYHQIEGGWNIDRKTVKSFEDLPVSAQKFIFLIEGVSGLYVKYIGIGPDNDDLIIR